MNEEEEERQRRAAAEAVGMTSPEGSNVVAPAPAAPTPAPEAPAAPVEQRTTTGLPAADANQMGVSAAPVSRLANVERTPTGLRVVVDRGGTQRVIELGPDQRSWPAAFRAAGETDDTLATQVIMQVPNDPEPAPRGPRVPPGNVMEQTFATATSAPVTAETQAMAADAGEHFAAAQRKQQALELEQVRRAAEGEREAAEVETRAADLQQQAFEERERETQSRLASLDETIDRVANNRIDPDAFFGESFGRRIGAGIMVALGGLAQAFRGGGPNAGAEIIDQMIERNIAAQEANQANDRAAAGLEGQAFGMFRRMLGDNDAAREATRAAHLRGVQQRVSAMIAGAAPDQVAALRSLEAALGEMAQASQAAARDQGRWSIETSVTRRRVGTPQAMERAATEQMLSKMSPSERQAYVEAMSRVEAERRGAGGRGRGRGAGRPVRPRRPGESREEYARIVGNEEAVSALTARAGAEGAAVRPDFAASGILVPIPGQEGRMAALASLHAGEEGRLNELESTAATFLQDLNALDAIIRTRDENGNFDPARRTRMAGLIHRIETRMQQQANMGVLNADFEIERLREMVGPFSEMETADWARRFSPEQRISDLREGINNTLYANFSRYGLAPNTPRGIARAAGRSGINVPEAPESTAPAEAPPPPVNAAQALSTGFSLANEMLPLREAGSAAVGLLPESVRSTATDAYQAIRDRAAAFLEADVPTRRRMVGIEE
jgi:hypothetical protein